MTIGIDGMASGLDTSAIIDQLVAIQRNQQVLLKQKSSTASNLVSALQSLNSRVASLATAAEKVSDPASWGVTKASSSSEAVTVAASATAKPGSLKLEVQQLAAGQVSLLHADDLSDRFTLRTGEQTHEITLTSTHPDDIIAAINDLRGETGISATRIRTGTAADGTPTYDIQLTGTSGEQNSFQVLTGHESAGDTLAAAGTTIAEAKDAVVSLWPGSAGAVELRSATNTFEDVLEGVDLTVSRTTAGDEPVRIDVATDSEAQVKLADELVSNLSIVLSDIESRTRTTTSTDSSGNTVVTGGLFSGDSAIRFLTSNLQSAMTSPVDGKSPSSIGISIDRYGVISLDKTVFGKALAEDAEGTMAAVQAIAARVGEVAERASSKSEGTITQKITSQESVVKDLGTQIAKWDERLESRRAQLVAQFSAMEVRLSQLQSTQSWLTNQIAGLNASAK